MNPIIESSKRQLIVNDYLDVVKARLRAREVARELGFGTVDQARISLAAGELARVLARNMVGAGQISIFGIKTNGHMGIQVVSLDPNSTPHHVNPNHAESNGDQEEHKDSYDALTDIFALVDEYLVEEQNHSGKRVTLMKWLS